MPIRAHWTWLGATPHLGKPRLALGRMVPDSPILPAAAGSLPASSPFRKGVERRFEAGEDPCAVRLQTRFRGRTMSGGLPGSRGPCAGVRGMSPGQMFS